MTRSLTTRGHSTALEDLHHPSQSLPGILSGDMQCRPGLPIPPKYAMNAVPEELGGSWASASRAGLRDGPRGRERAGGWSVTCGLSVRAGVGAGGVACMWRCMIVRSETGARRGMIVFSETGARCGMIVFSEVGARCGRRVCCGESIVGEPAGDAKREAGALCRGCKTRGESGLRSAERGSDANLLFWDASTPE